MKRFITLTLLFAAVVFSVKANPVDVSTARDVAMKFANATSKSPVRSMDEVQLAATYNITRGEAAFYVFNTPNGFVIVSADDCATPILGYSNEGRFNADNMPIQMEGWLQAYVSQIQYGIENQLVGDEQTANEWELVKATGRISEQRATTAVEPLLTDIWHQNCYYNSMSPIDENGPCGHAYAGCVATAMSQIMRYWGYPVSGTDSHTYTPENYPDQPQTANFGETIYDWDNMPDSLTESSTQEQINAVATLMHHSGVAVNMKFGGSESTAYMTDVPNALIDYFGYSTDATVITKSSYSNGSWMYIIKGCLDKGRPIHYRGASSDWSNSGHAFVCDGYDSDNYLHFNWGWGGVHNGYYPLNALKPGNSYVDYSYGGFAVINIHPEWECIPDTMYQVTASANYTYRGTVTGSGTYECGEECTLTATAKNGYAFGNWSENGVVVSTDATYSFVVKHPSDFVANFVSAGNISFTYDTVKSICLEYWDTNNDGELSYAEAAAVTSLYSSGENNQSVFKGNTASFTFNELRYFTGLTTIESTAFDGCTKLTSITIPNTVTSIGNYAFRNCKGLTSITIPNSVVLVGNSVFSGCTGLTSITIPNSVVSIGSSSFNGCTNLTSIVIPNSVSYIEDNTFKDCTKLTTITIPNSMVSIGNYAFSNCTSLTSIEIPNSVTSIGEYAFEKCIGLTSIDIPNSVVSINRYAFQDCTGLTSIEIPDSVTTLGYGVFNKCTGLELVIIGNSVTRIEPYMFSGCTSLTSVTIGNSVTYIGTDAFFRCTGLTSIEIPNSVTSIYYAFRSCYGLTSIEIPNSVTSIGNYSFYDCKNLASVTLGNSVKYIKERAFSSCSSLTSIVIPDSVTSIGESAFYACSSMESLIIGNSVTTIGEDAFRGCNGLTSIVVASGNPNYDSRDNSNALIETSSNTLIMGCKNTVIPNTVTSIGKRAFGNCIDLTSIEIPNSVSSIGEHAFSSCTGLSSIDIPNSVISISEYAFSSCTGLTSVTIGNSVSSIEKLAFSGCKGLTSIIVRADTPPTLGTNVFWQVPYNTLAYVPCGAGEDYKAGDWKQAFYYIMEMCGGSVAVSANPSESGIVSGEGNYVAGETCTVSATANEGCCFVNWTNNGTIVSTNAEYTFPVTSDIALVANFMPDGNIVFTDGTVKTICVSNWDKDGDGELSYFEAASVTSLGTVFKNNTSITSFNELQYFVGLKTISDQAFYGCTGLTTVKIPNTGVTSIGYSAFYGCTKLTSIEIPNFITSIGQSAFQNCAGLTLVEIPNSVTSIGSSVFSGCYSLTSVEIPNSITSIGGAVFSGCTSLTSIEIPNSVTSIGNYAFQNCTSLESVTIGNSVTSINYRTFYGCSSLSSMEIPNSVKSIEGSAFQGCTSLTSIEIPNSVTSIGNSVFQGCSALESVTIGNSVTSIGNQAFQDCTTLESVAIGNSVTSIGNQAFYNCTSLTSIEIPNTVTSIEKDTFKNCTSLTSVTIGNSVATIGEYVFAGCTGLTSIEIPNSVTSIGNYSFYDCKNLASVTLGNSVKYIKERAFQYCSSLTSILIPDSVTSIGNNAFYYCTGLTEITLLGTNVPSLGTSVFYNTKNCPIYVPYESLNDYKAASNWSSYKNRIYPMAYTTVSGYGDSTDSEKWAFIASPLTANTTPTSISNMIGTEYDLYRFNQSAEREWENHKAHGFSLTNGQGYLYANAEDANVIFNGTFNTGNSQDVPLTYHEDSNLAGWNLVGNPFPVQAYANRSYYKMNEEGTGIDPTAASMETAIPACMGIMVKAENTGESVPFSKTAPSAAANNGVLQIAVAQANTRGNVLQDKTIVSFNAGDELGKFYFGESDAKLYIPQNGKELAIATAAKTGELPLNFKATKNGEYTLSFDVANVIASEAKQSTLSAEFDYLHLIDNLNGANVDLLQTNEYTFTAKTTDYASRFRLVFSPICEDADDDNETFAFVSNGNIVITADAGTASLQVIDMMGRVVVSCGGHTRCVPMAGIPSGVYILRLINGNDVMTQKIVIE